MVFFEPPVPSPPTLQPTYPRVTVTNPPPPARSHSAQPDGEETGDVIKQGLMTSMNGDVMSPGRSTAPVGSSKDFREFTSTRNTEIERCNSLKYKVGKMKKDSQEARNKAKENCSVM
jgi:hypothetical protein